MQGNSSATNTTIYAGFSGIFADIVAGDNLDNFNVSSGDWIDVYTLLGLPVGYPLVLENLGRSSMLAAINETKPTESTGYSIIRGSEGSGRGAYVSQGSSKLWLKSPSSSQTVSVQLAI